MSALIWSVAVVLLIVAVRRGRRSGRHGGVGSAAVGAVYGFLNEDKQKAVEIVVEGRAEARDPEDRDGNLPDLETPKQDKQKCRNAGTPSSLHSCIPCILAFLH